MHNYLTIQTPYLQKNQNTLIDVCFYHSNMILRNIENLKTTLNYNGSYSNA
jgi:hypothetical protein